MGRVGGKAKREGAGVSECVGVTTEDRKGLRTWRGGPVGPLNSAHPHLYSPLLTLAKPLSSSGRPGEGEEFKVSS